MKKQVLLYSIFILLILLLIQFNYVDTTQAMTVQDTKQTVSEKIVIPQNKEEDKSTYIKNEPNSDIKNKIQTKETTTNIEIGKTKDGKYIASRGMISRGAIPFTRTELDMLAKIIHAEANDEPYIGKIAVGAVIMNRIKSERFPNTIEEVIFQKNQFSPTFDGGYKKAKPTQEDYKAAIESLMGTDPTGDALFFYAPSLTKQRWHEKLQHTITIEGHKFFKYK